MKFIISTLLLCCTTFVMLAQEKSDQGYFLFEEEAFSLPIKDMIAAYEGFPATPFMANNLKGDELYIGDFKGSGLLLLFWQIDNQTSLDHLETFKKINQTYSASATIVSFVDADRTTAKKFAKTNGIDFHIIPNSALFGEAAYSKGLGSPRMFIIDEFGVIKKVVPQEAFDLSENSFDMLSNLIMKVL